MLTEKVEEFEESIERETRSLSAQQSGQSDRIDLQEFRRIPMAQFAFGDEVPDLQDEVCFGEGQLRIGQSQIREDVAAAFGDFDPLFNRTTLFR